MEVRVDGPSRDLHSGVFGGSVANPVMALSRLLAACVDANGHITVPGFYDDVRPLAEMGASHVSTPAVRRPGLRAISSACRLWRVKRDLRRWNSVGRGRRSRSTASPAAIKVPAARPLCPRGLSAKITCRLVPDQNPERVCGLVERHLRRNVPPSVRLTIIGGHHAAVLHATERSRRAGGPGGVGEGVRTRTRVVPRRRFAADPRRVQATLGRRNHSGRARIARRQLAFAEREDGPRQFPPRHRHERRTAPASWARRGNK